MYNSNNFECGDIAYAVHESNGIRKYEPRKLTLYDMISNVVFEPVSILQKFLEMNEFKRIDGNNYVYKNNDWIMSENDDVIGGFPIKIDMKADIGFWHCTITAPDGYIECKPSDMHELQHALKAVYCFDLAKGLHIE